jgi:hypothetical protein
MGTPRLAHGEARELERHTPRGQAENRHRTQQVLRLTLARGHDALT